MSIQSALALPFDIVIDGRKGKLYPASLYEVGLIESSFAAFLTRQAYEATEGLPSKARQSALDAAAFRIADLATDALPAIQWVIGTSEGLSRMLAHCIELDDGTSVSPREAGRWHNENGGDIPGNMTDKWLIASSFRSDPTLAVGETAQVESSEATDSESSTDA